jgi:hypothetical protein
MTRQILFLIILTGGLSCKFARQEDFAEQSVITTQDTQLMMSGTDKAQDKAKENIRFDFTAVRINTFKETIEIKASLYNDNADTVYFLSSSCDGEQYSLRYDTAKFVLTPFLNCNTSYPRIIKIAPKAKHDFQAHFRFSSTETKIKLGFDFYLVDKSFDLTNYNLGDINIFNRPKDKQTIVWANEKTIK